MARKTSLEQKMEMFLANDALGRENATLRADLAAAKEQRDALAAHVERLEKGLRVARELTREEPDIYVVGIRRVIDELIAATPAQSLEAVTAPLKAHVERLVGALECVPVDLIHAIENGDTGANVFLSAGSCKLIGDAIAATPAQSLAAHDAALLREVAERKTWSMDGGRTWMISKDELLTEADRIEKEAE